MFTDSHAHLDDARFDADREAVLKRAWDSGVRKILTIGNGRGPDDMACGIPIADKYEFVLTTVGIHPHDAARAEARHFTTMREQASHSRVVAIGEAGLDYHYDNSPREVQRDVFRMQAKLARDLHLPLIVHTRNADEDTERILDEVGPPRGVIHCFTSGERLARFAVDLGFWISFSGIATFPKAGPLRAIARALPDDRILVETDCPYLAPEPHRGKRNEPAFLLDTAAAVAAERGMATDDFAALTSGNFDRLFCSGL